MSCHSVQDGTLIAAAEEFEHITPGEVVAFRTIGPHGEVGMQMVRGTLSKSSAYIALPVHTYDEGQRLSRLAHVLALDAVGQLKYVLDQLTQCPGLFGSTEYAAVIAAFKEATQEAVNNLTRAEIDKKIHHAETYISQLETRRKKLDESGADAYEVFLRRP